MKIQEASEKHAILLRNNKFYRVTETGDWLILPYAR